MHQHAQHAQFLLALAKGQWACNESTFDQMVPLADRVLAGESLELLQAHYQPVAAELKRGLHTASPISGLAAGGTPRAFRMGWFTDLDLIPEGSIAVVGVVGMILKYGMCGIGSMDRADRIIEAANHPNVAGIMLEIDTPGGQVAGLSTLWDAIIEARKQKPVLAFINDGDCYSAGYNTASACTEIWASHGTCGVGSIGTMCQFTDTREADKKAGIVRKAVYATASTEKNAKYQRALDGDTTEIVKELDTLNEDFHEKILSQRAAKIGDTSKVFKGQTYGAAEGVKLGLVDTIGSREQALSRIAELAQAKPATGPADPLATENTPNDTPNPNSSTMKYAMIAAAAGVAAKDLVTTAEGSHLQVAHLDAIEAQLVEAAAAKGQFATAQAQLSTAQGELTTTRADLATAQGDVTAKAGEITALKEKLAKAPAATEAAKPGQEQPPVADPNGAAAADSWESQDAAMLADLNARRAEYTL